MGGDVDMLGLTETEHNLLMRSYSLSANTGVYAESDGETFAPFRLASEKTREIQINLRTRL